MLTDEEVICAGQQIDPVELVRDVLLLHAEGKTTLPAEAYLGWTNPEGAQARSLVLPGAVWGGYGAIGLKMINASLDNPSRGLNRADGWTFLFDPHTARPMAMLPAAWISATRTAAYTSLSVRTLGVSNPKRVAVLGCGSIAQAHLRLLTKELPSAQFITYDLDSERSQKTALHWGAEPASSSREAVEGADIVVCATTVDSGYIAYDWLSPGALIAHVSLDDVLPEVVHRADLLVVDDWDLVASDRRRILGRMIQDGSVRAPEWSAASPTSGRRVDATLADVLVGGHSGRRTDTEIVLSNPFGMGILDVALASVIWRTATRT